MRVLRFISILALLATVVPAPCFAQDRGSKPKSAQPKIRQAKQEFKAGQAAEKRGDWTGAFDLYSRAARDWPGNRPYRVRESLARFHLVQAREYQAESDAAAGRLAAARQNLQLAQALDPSYPVVRQRLAEIDQMLAHRPGAQAQPWPKLPQVRSEPGRRSFDYHGDTEGAYQLIAREFGLSAAFDPQLPHQLIRFRVNDVDFRTAMRLVGEMTGTFWRALTPRLFFVAANTPAKVRQYAPSIVRTVELRASQTPSGMEDTTRVVRDIAEITSTQLNTATHTLTLRGTPRQVALATALVHEIEQPRGEILLEMDILDVNHGLAQQIGITPPSSASAYTISPTQIQEAQQSLQGLIDVITQVFGQPSAIAGMSQSQIEALLGAGQLNASSLIPALVAFGGGRTRFLSTLPGAVAQLAETLDLVRSGQQVMLRAEDGEPATFFVGDRFPVALNQYSSSLASSTLVPQVGSATFPTSNFPTGVKPVAVVAADFNGDGYADLAVANQTDNTVSILTNNGTGSFTAGETIQVPSSPVALVAGDFNGDGKLDLAIVSGASKVVSIFLGNGDGTFRLEGQFPLDSGADAIVAADFNAGGVLDLAVANGGANTVSILLGRGDGTFEAPFEIPVGTNPVALAASDFNNDRKEDLAVVDQGDDNVMILTGAGDGTFQRGGTFATGKTPVAVAAADFNNDGNIDLAVANQADNTISILLGKGDATFQPAINFQTGQAPSAILAADFNLNGFPDLAVANENDNTVSVLLNNGQGAFNTGLTLATGASPDALASADFDQNGFADLAVANQGGNNVSVIYNDINLVPSSTALTGTGLSAFPGVQYIDIGLKVTVTPRLHPDGEVTLKMNVEIHGLTPQSVNGIPVITNRTIQQVVRVKEGQPTLLVSFLNPQESLTLTGWPGLAPLAARNRSNQREELVIVVRPRLIRMPKHKSETLFAGIGGGQGPTPVFPPPALPLSPAAPAPSRPRGPLPPALPPSPAVPAGPGLRRPF
ncbi:MAG TPA: FG-GAP-like repeat-containing protein [Candidatus Dormibacteraeota bacterium]|nr:FG-GAP-like repeat-containing protein [Candidatus Dormibacteraeota bacterium]